jgi:hypothetical protein
MAYSYVQYVGNSSTVTFSVPFPYISKEHVEVRINNVLKTVGTDYTWTSSSAITFVTAPGTGLTVDIRRKSSPSARLVDFQDGSTLTQDILDADSNQNFFLAQEATDAVDANIALATDGVFDAKSKRIKNLADPVNAQDAVTKTWAENAMSSQLSQATAQAATATAKAAESLASANASAASQASASGSAATASTKASEASASATSAASSATSATNSKNAAATSETNAAASAAAAASSASSASTSSATATTKANEAAASAVTATTKASDAAGSATQAANSATGAATSATNAASSASSASGSATSAASSASQASTSATNAASSATSAGTSATTATTKAAEASASATTATTQASTATTKASEAAASAVSAANSAAAAATALDNFDDRYLGQKTADPTLDNDGNALVTGALYFNTTTGKMRVFTGSGWIDASSASVATLAVFNYTATAGQTTFSGNDAAGVNLVYTVGALIVTLNGIDLKNGVDFTASTGSSVVLASGAAAGDELRVYAFGNFQVADTYSQAAADAKFVQKKIGTNKNLVSGNPVQLPSGVTLSSVNDAYSQNLPLELRSGTMRLTANNSDGSGGYITLGNDAIEYLRADSSGRVTKPYQPAFCVAGNPSFVGANTVTFSVTYVNVGNHWNGNNTFTAPVAGRYWFGFSGMSSAASDPSNVSIRKNGVSQMNSYVKNDSYLRHNVNIILNLAANDTVTLYLEHGGLHGGWDSFSGCLIG